MRVFLGRGNAVAMNVDERIRPLLRQARCRLPRTPVSAAVVRQMGGRVQLDRDAPLFKRLLQFRRYVVDAAARFFALGAVGGDV